MRPNLAAVALPLLLLLLSASAQAQEAAPKGMPQLDFATPLTISQVVWMVVIFVLLYLALSAWALPQVGRVLADRATRIANDLNTARSAKAEADAAASEAREAGKQAHAEAQGQINSAVDAAKREAALQAEALNATLEARLAAAETSIEAARAAAMASLRDIATGAAAGMVERLSGRPADRATVDRAVGALLPQHAG